MIRQNDVVVRCGKDQGSVSGNLDPDLVDNRSVIGVPHPIPDQTELVLAGTVYLYHI